MPSRDGLLEAGWATHLGILTSLLFLSLPRVKKGPVQTQTAGCALGFLQGLLRGGGPALLQSAIFKAARNEGSGSQGQWGLGHHASQKRGQCHPLHPSPVAHVALTDGRGHSHSAQLTKLPDCRVFPREDNYTAAAIPKQGGEEGQCSLQKNHNLSHKASQLEGDRGSSKPPPSPASPRSPTKRHFHCFPNTQVPLGALPAQNAFPRPLKTVP